MIVEDSLSNYLSEFPKLIQSVNFLFKSKTDNKYNCIAWALIRDDLWVDAVDVELDGIFWPATVPKGKDLFHLEALFKAYEYSKCDDFSFEDGFMKIALFEKEMKWSHAARQLPSGQWASKMGMLEDIHHNSPHDLEGSGYGTIYLFMKRRNSSYKTPKKKS